MKKLSPFWVFFSFSLVFLVGLVASYVLQLPSIWEGAFFAGLILTVLLGKLRMGLGAVGRQDIGGNRKKADDDDNPLSISMGNLWRRSGESLEEIRKRNQDQA